MRKKFKQSKGTKKLQWTKWGGWKDRLVVRIPVITTLIIAVVMTVMCAILGFMTSQTVSAQINKEVSYVAEVNAKAAMSYLENMNTAARMLSQELSRFQNFDDEVKKSMIRNALKDNLADEKIFACYVALEPNLFIKNTPNGYSVYAYPDGGILTIDINEDYDVYASSDYYAPTKESMKTHVSEPYEYQLSNGEVVWLITLSTPILDSQNRFVGVANCDILTDTISGLDFENGGYDSSYSYIITGKGAYISNTADASLVGSAFDGDARIMAAAQAGVELMVEGPNVHSGNEQAWFMHEPITLEGSDLVWSSAFVVNKSEAMASATRITLLTALIGLLGIVLLAFCSALAIRKALAPVKNVLVLAENMGNGNLKASESTVMAKDELGQIAHIFTHTAQVLSGYIEEIQYALNAMADGNLDVSIHREFIGDFEEIKAALEHITVSLNTTFHEIVVAADQVASGADQVASGAQGLSQGATQQAAAIQELSATIDEVSEQINHNANNAQAARQIAAEAQAEVSSGNTYMKEMTGAMQSISTASHEIDKIIKTIDDIAFQTNILALNAAVEAARAGEAGRGFAVVADEVRNLAKKSAEAASDTSELIKHAVDAVENGTNIAGKTADTLEVIVRKVGAMTAMVDEIARDSAKQATSVGEITEGVEQISAVVQTNSATAEESAAASEELSGQAAMLKELVGRFHLSDRV